MTRACCGLLFLPLIAVLSGCPVTQPQETPVPTLRRESAQTHSSYWLYVPSNYKPDRDWPLVVTLHGTHGWDSSVAQISEWKALAEQKGMIVVAPDLRCVQGILPVVRSLWYKDMATDETNVLAIIDEICGQYRIAPKSILLTGFSAGGYPMYYIGLRHPERFSMLVARSCNSDVGLFEKIELTDAARRLPIMVFWGRDDMGIQKQCWGAVEYLKTHGFKNVHLKMVKGGHLRRPDLTYAYWQPHLPTTMKSP
jgi:poly(3-hydroxybutyrate) depolymerase